MQCCMSIHTEIMLAKKNTQVAPDPGEIIDESIDDS